ncbi:MAG: NAD(P)/FAD-dependent oxidoreductase [Thermodesulfovibrionales bacterium]|jgi:thioredoxin reductase (NADPH)
MENQRVHDCIIIGAGPGGLQAAIYLGRYNRDVLLLDRGGGRTWHARRIENFLTQREISGREIIETGLEQARSFHVHVEREAVGKIEKGELFKVYTGEKSYSSPFVIVSSGVYDNLPPVEGIHRFLGISFFTCMDCDGYRTTGKKLVIIGNSPKTVDLAVAMKAMFTRDITLLLYTDKLPPEYKEELEKEEIPLVISRPKRIIGELDMEAVELSDGTRIPCEVVMSHFGYKLNDGFLSGLDLKRDAKGFKYIVDHTYESSMDGLYIVGPLNQGNDQAIIAAGEGAIAAIEIKKRLLFRMLP